MLINMKNSFARFRNRILSGILYLLPVFVLLMLIQKAWLHVHGIGQKFATMLGIKNIIGVAAAPIIASVLIIVVAYFAGWLVNIHFFNELKEKLEKNLLEYIPGYTTMKIKMQENIENKGDQREPVLIKYNNVFRPALLVSEHEGKSVVFIPNTPETNAGEVYVVNNDDVQKLNTSNKIFVESIKNSGKGLPI